MKTYTLAMLLGLLVLLSGGCAAGSSPTPVPTPLPTATPAPTMILGAADLTDLIAAWNSRDVTRVRSLYSDGARYFEKQDALRLARQEALDVLVSGEGFARHMGAYEGLTLRLLGAPSMFYDKLVAYLFRWQGDAEGYNGAGLLRYEGDKILLHAVVVDERPSANPVDDTAYLGTANLDKLMQVWNDADETGAHALYTDDACILADEDMLQDSWRDFAQPPDVSDLLRRFATWDPVIVGTPVRAGSVVIFAWHWTFTDYPGGYGLRLVQFEGERIAVDLRMAIRPWEATGKPFSAG